MQWARRQAPGYGGKPGAGRAIVLCRTLQVLRFPWIAFPAASRGAGQPARPGRRPGPGRIHRACAECWSRARWRSWADVQLGAYLGVGAPLGQQAQYRQLAAGQRVGRWNVGLRWVLGVVAWAWRRMRVRFARARICSCRGAWPSAEAAAARRAAAGDRSGLPGVQRLGPAAARRIRRGAGNPGCPGFSLPWPRPQGRFPVRRP